MIAWLDLFVFWRVFFSRPYEVRPSSDEWNSGAQVSEHTTQRNMEKLLLPQKQILHNYVNFGQFNTL